MSSTRRALVLHLTGGGEPIWIAMNEQDADELTANLPSLMENGATQPIPTVDGTTVVVNFAHVATALVSSLSVTAQVYGNTAGR